MTNYNGIELTDLGKEVRQSHSVLLEANQGTDWLERLFACDKKALTPDQFRTVSALGSVVGMNYQICNGGLDQYYFNGYDAYREPCNDQDTARLDKEAQETMLRTLVEFALAVYPERASETAKLAAVTEEFVNSSYEGADYDEDDYWEEEGGVFVADGFDTRYYEVNDFLEQVMEAYAQYTVKEFAVA